MDWQATDAPSKIKKGEIMLPWQERLLWRVLYVIFMYVRHGRFSKLHADEIELQLREEYDRQ